MHDILIRGISLPEGELKYVSLWVYGDGRVYVSNNASAASSQRLQDLAVPLPEGHGNLIEQKALNLFPDYKEVRNGIKRTIKEAERDGRVITGVSIDLLKQTLVALDSLRSVRRYFLNAKTIVPAEGVIADGN